MPAPGFTTKYTDTERLDALIQDVHDARAVVYQDGLLQLGKLPVMADGEGGSVLSQTKSILSFYWEKQAAGRVYSLESGVKSQFGQRFGSFLLSEGYAVLLGHFQAQTAVVLLQSEFAVSASSIIGYIQSHHTCIYGVHTVSIQ
jgi:hypothetical protein